MRANQVVALSVAALCTCHFALLGLTEKKCPVAFTCKFIFYCQSFFKLILEKMNPMQLKKKILPERWWYETEMSKVKK